ncbi:MAG: PAS domain S-box protein [Proteobacteria bacterium]|nr:PAS domain S-box protein [Pseudomonadota bacterium]
MTDKSMLPENTTSRLRLLMLARVAIVTFLLGIAAFIDIKGMEPFSAISATALFRTIILTYILFILYLLLLKYVRNLSLNIYTQSLCDVLLITGMVYATGGIRSIYSAFYPLVIIYSVLFLGRRGGLVIASAAAILYGLFANLEFYGVIYPLHSIPVYDKLLDTGYFITRISTHVLSFYLIAFLTSFAVEKEKQTRTLLARKQSDFDQLNLLHRSIIESVDTGILTVNKDGKIKSLNRAAAEITGFSFSKVINQYFSDVFPDFPVLRGKQNAAEYRPVAKTHFETPFHTGDGRSLLLSCSVSPLRDHENVEIGNIVIFQDLTEISEMRESLEKSRRLAFIGEVAAGLAHEIRNPLSSISGSIQMLMQDPSHKDTNEKLMQIILRGKDQLENFLKDFLLMARPAPGIREEIDVVSTIREVVESLRCIQDWHEPLEVVMRLPYTPLSINANKTEIRQVIWNLVLNAVQAMPQGGVLTIEARPAKINETEGVEIRIIDTGCGIDRQDLTKIFEPFYTTRETGTGLGLAVVGRLVEGYEGKIHVQSKSAEGTICRIWFPCRVSPAETVAA